MQNKGYVLQIFYQNKNCCQCCQNIIIILRTKTHVIFLNNMFFRLKKKYNLLEDTFLQTCL